MTTVRIELRVPGNGGERPAAGAVHWTPTRRRVTDTHVILPESFAVELIDGVATVDVTPSSGTWAWKVQEWVGGQHETRYVAVPASDAVLEYAALADVDPATLEPSAEPEAAWWLALQQLQLDGVDPEALRPVVADIVDEHVESAAPHPIYDEMPDLTLIFENNLL